MPLTEELLSLPSVDEAVNMVVRLLLAAVFGGLIGAEREAVGKAAGLRTHMLVSLGAALFVLTLAQRDVAGDISRVIQGVAAGIGFIGAGTILKHQSEERVTGLTTAASIWLTAAVGVAAGIGSIWMALFATAAAWIVLNAFERLGHKLSPPDAAGKQR
jgi:putative Mg2+ transporter-C (MgtC) family protein